VNTGAGSYLSVFLLTTVQLAAQWLNYPTPGIPRTTDGKPNLTAPARRTSDGKPDLTGLWTGFGGGADLGSPQKRDPHI